MLQAAKGSGGAFTVQVVVDGTVHDLTLVDSEKLESELHDANVSLRADVEAEAGVSVSAAASLQPSSAGPAEVPGDVTEPAAVSESMTRAELDAVAAHEGVAVPAGSTKAGVLKAIVKARKKAAKA